MKCPEAARLIHDYLDKDIDEYSYQQLFSHLKVCNECNNHYQELKRTEQLLMILPAIKTTPAFADIVIQSIPKKTSSSCGGINFFISFLRKYFIL